MNEACIREAKDSLEVATLDILGEASRHEESLQPLYDELARCTNIIPVTLQQRAEEQIGNLGRSSANLRTAQTRVLRMQDELSARLRDEKKSLNRKWYLPNPPTNASIDLREQESGHFARGMNLYKVLIVLFIGSFAGVIIELLWCLITNGYLESRSGLVYGPFNLLYGVGAAALSMALYRFRNRGKWLSFAGGFFIGSAVEYLCSMFMEAAFGSRSWDYSHLPFNLNGRICLMYSVFWGILGVIWIKDIYPRLAKWILRLPQRPGKALVWLATLFLLVNCAVSGFALLRWSERNHGVPADNFMRVTFDQRFPDERMESVYANMVFD